jgi:hypothetical protein
VSPARVAALFIENAAIYGPAAVSTVRAIWQTIVGTHPELRAAPEASEQEAIDARIDARLRALGLLKEDQ